LQDAIIDVKIALTLRALRNAAIGDLKGWVLLTVIASPRA
jgi:hypothetical protein